VPLGPPDVLVVHPPGVVAVMVVLREEEATPGVVPVGTQLDDASVFL
jgi:hypothetical protein